jgi:aspartate aminotransferase-like enzyme
MTKAYRHSELKKYGDRWLAFPGEFLGKKGGDNAPTPTQDESTASQIMRDTFERTWKPGTDAVSHMHQIERRALDAINRDGLQAFIENHSKRESEEK